MSWDVLEDMERRGLLDFLLGKHLLRIRKSSYDALFRLGIELYNETRYQPWARLISPNIYSIY